MPKTCITSIQEQTQSIVSVLEDLLNYIHSKNSSISSLKDAIKFIDSYNREHDLLNYDNTIFNIEYDTLIGRSILETYDKITTDHMFTTVLQICDGSNLNLLEHLWSAVLLVDHIVDMMNDDNLMKYLPLKDFNYFIFLKLDKVDDSKIFKLLNDLIKAIRYENRIEFIPFPFVEQLYDTLYNLRLEDKLNKIDLLLLLDGNDDTNLKNLKVIETLGLVQPLSFLISTTQNKAYSRYVHYTPWEKNVLIRECTKQNEECPGRWNLVYQTKCIRTGLHQNLDIELTRCVEYLDG